MGQALDNLHNWFTKEGWQFTQDEFEGLQRFLMPCAGDKGNWNCVAFLDEVAHQFRFFSVLPEAIPPQRRPHVLEFISRVNCRLILGNYEMELETGLLRYRTSVDYTLNELNDALIHSLVAPNVATFNDYLPGIQRTLQSDEMPKDILENIAQWLPSRG
jgi:hypothetical protein